MRGAVDVALEVGEGEDGLPRGVPAKVHLVLSAEGDGAEVELDDQEGEMAPGVEMAVGEGVEDVGGRVDAPAKLGTLARRAAEADVGDEVRVSRAVVDSRCLLDLEGRLELRVHAVHGLVPEARHVDDLHVALLGDGPAQVGQVCVQARREGRLEHAVGLVVVLRVEEARGRGDVEDLCVDDGALGHAGIVVFAWIVDGRACAERDGAERNGAERDAGAGLVVVLEGVGRIERLEVALLLLLLHIALPVDLHAQHVVFMLRRGRKKVALVALVLILLLLLLVLLLLLLLLPNVAEGVCVDACAGSARHGLSVEGFLDFGAKILVREKWKILKREKKF